jgi:hypothetical protein
MIALKSASTDVYAKVNPEDDEWAALELTKDLEASRHSV